MTNLTNDGLLIVFTGNGKGKTTAALGMAMRSAGWGEKVAIVQFIKGYKKTGEWQMIERIDEIDIYQTVDDKKLGIDKPESRHNKPAKDALRLAKKLISDSKHNLVILDEINNAIHHGLLEVGEIMKLIKDRPVEVTIVFTGRDAPAELIEIADLVTEMKEIKHPFKKGISAKRGVDY